MDVLSYDYYDMNQKTPSWIIRYLAFCIDMLAWLLIIPWLINIYRFLHNKQTLGYMLLGLELENTKEEKEFGFKQTLVRMFTHSPFAVTFLAISYIVFVSLIFLWRVINDETLGAIAIFGTTLLTFLSLASLLFPFVSSLFTPTLSERRSKTKTVHKKKSK